MVRGWRAVVGLGLALCCSGLGGAEAEGREQERIYQRTDTSGRVVYTNIGNVSEGGAPLSAIELRELLKMDLSAASQGDLSALDARVAQLHETTRKSGACAQIRAASQGSVATRMWNEEQPELLACTGLMGLTMLFGLLGSGSVVSWFRLALVAGSVSTGYQAASDAWARHGQLEAGRRACSSELPAGDSTDVDVVKKRLGLAADFQRSVQGLFDAREGNLDNRVRHSLR